MANRECCPDPNCGMWIGEGHHHPRCKLAPVEVKAQMLERYYGYWLQSVKHQEWLREQITLWQGKFLIVKNENNKLRRKLYQREHVKD